MPKVFCYINENVQEQLEQIKIDEGFSSLSKTMQEMLTLGIRVYLHNKEKGDSGADKMEELVQQHSKFLLRILALNTDILHCVYDNKKITEGTVTVEERIALHKQKVDHFIEGFINN